MQLGQKVSDRQHLDTVIVQGAFADIHADHFPDANSRLRSKISHRSFPLALPLRSVLDLDGNDFRFHADLTFAGFDDKIDFCATRRPVIE